MRSSVNEANNKFLSVCNGKLVDCCTNFSLIDGDKIYAQVFPDSYLGIVDWSPEIEDNLRRLLGDEQLDIDQDSSYLFLIRLSSCRSPISCPNYLRLTCEFCYSPRRT